jgi:hypothetical protein
VVLSYKLLNFCLIVQTRWKRDFYASKIYIPPRANNSKNVQIHGSEPRPGIPICSIKRLTSVLLQSSRCHMPSRRSCWLGMPTPRSRNFLARSPSAANGLPSGDPPNILPPYPMSPLLSLP